jgi:hypothetical protein
MTSEQRNELIEKRQALQENLTRPNGMTASGLERLAETLGCDANGGAVFDALTELEKGSPRIPHNPNHRGRGGKPNGNPEIPDEPVPEE